MCSSCAMSLSESLIRKPPSVVAATTGRVSSDTSRVLMRQFCMARREPGPLGAFGIASSCSAGPAGAAGPAFALTLAFTDFPRPFAFTAAEVSGPAPSTAGPRFWACWGEEPRSVPPRGSCSAAALPSLLNRPCTSVATSGPGVPPGDRWDGVESWGTCRPMVVVGDRRVFLSLPPRSARCRATCAPADSRGGPANSSTVEDLQQGASVGPESRLRLVTDGLRDVRLHSVEIGLTPSKQHGCQGVPVEMIRSGMAHSVAQCPFRGVKLTVHYAGNVRSRVSKLTQPWPLLPGSPGDSDV